MIDMCLAVPGQIVEVNQVGDDSVIGRIGVIDLQGSRVEASLAMTPEAETGDWVLIHAGFALNVLDEAEAKATWDALREAMGDDLGPPGGPDGA